MGSVSDTGSDHKNQDRYWFWTSVDINKNGFQAGENSPYDRQHGRWKILYFQFPDNYKNLKRNDL